MAIYEQITGIDLPLVVAYPTHCVFVYLSFGPTEGLS